MAQTTFSNTLAGNATVEAQIGNLQGDAVFHRHTTIYNTVDADSPERRIEVALNHFRAGSVRVAEQVLTKLLRDGHADPRIAYYVAVAVVSGRTASDLGQHEVSTLRSAEAIGRSESGEWSTAVAVVVGAVWRTLHIADETVPARQRELRNDLLSYLANDAVALSRDRYAEIARHLVRLLEVVQSDQWADYQQEFAAWTRFDRGRTDRAWRFFEPEPTPSRRARYRGNYAKMARAVLAALLGLLGAALLAGLAINEDKDSTEAIVAIATGFLVFYLGLTGVVAASRLKSANAADRVAEPSTTDVSDFYLGVARLVLTRFADAAPPGQSTWEKDTAGLRWSVVREFDDTYASVDVSPVSLNWLIRRRVDAIAARWSAKLPYQPVVPGNRGTYSGLCTFAGLMIIVTILATSKELLDVKDDAIILIVGMVASLLVAVAGFSLPAGEATRQRWLRRHSEQQLANDQEFLENYRDALRDRPDDGEIGTWLAADLLTIQGMGIQRLGIGRRDVLAQLVLTEGARQSTRTRVLHGIPRYSTYRTSILFLTDNGVREFVADLDMFTGVIHNEQRTSYRYEAIVSATLAEDRTRPAGHDRVILMPQISGPGTDNVAALLPNQLLAVSLVNGETRKVTVENFADLADTTVEDPGQLRELALSTSGVSAALRVLESVAGEGRDWTARERERLHQR